MVKVNICTLSPEKFHSIQTSTLSDNQSTYTEEHLVWIVKIELLNKQNQPSESKSLDPNPLLLKSWYEQSMYLCTMTTLGQQVEL